MREVTGANVRAFVAQGRADDLADQLRDAASAIDGMLLMEPHLTVRVYHNLDDEGHSVLVITEGYR